MQQKLDSVGRKILNAIYTHFLKSASWPTYRTLEVDFRAEGPLYEMVAKIDRKLLLIEDVFREESICYLTLKGLAICEGSAEDIQNIVNTAALFAKHYIENGGSATLSSDDIKTKLGLSDLEVARVCEMYWRFGWHLTTGGTRKPAERFSEFKINHHAMLFEGVKTLDEFFERVKDAESKEQVERRLNFPISSPQSSSICSMADKYGWCRDHMPTHFSSDGRAYCVFHAPRGKKNQTLHDFNKLVIDEIIKAKEAGTICNMSGAIFEGRISFRDHVKDNCFPKINFYQCEFGEDTDFGNLIFVNEANFQESFFHGPVNFQGAQFKKRTTFFRAVFKRSADFGGALFNNDANYGAALFKAYVSFGAANFNKDVTFTKVDFQDKVDFWEAIFSSTTSFTETRFRKGIDFEGISFHGDTNFSKTAFDNIADFTNTVFHKEMYFGDARFKQSALFMFSECHGKAHFSNAIFENFVNFQDFRFCDRASFIDSKFSRDVFFTSCMFENLAEFTGAQFDSQALFDHTQFKHLAVYEDVCFSAHASFEKTIFERHSNFSYARFMKKASFLKTVFKDLSRFENVDFRDTVDFSDVSYFSRATFDRTAFNDATFFFGQTFFEGASMRSLNVKANMRFEKVDLRQITFLDTDLRMMEFVNCDWNRVYGRELLYDEISLSSWPFEIASATRVDRKADSSNAGLAMNLGKTIKGLNHGVSNSINSVRRRFKGSFRQMIQREWQGFVRDVFIFLAKEDMNKVETLYRYLKQKYKEIYDEQMVSNWHYGEKEMYRKKNILRRCLPLSLSNLYWISSGYSERPFRAGLFLIGLMVVFSFFFFFAELDQLGRASVNVAQASKGFAEIADLRTFGSFILNTLQLATFQKETLYAPVTFWGQWLKILIQICIPLQSTLLVFALRNRFRR